MGSICYRQLAGGPAGMRKQTGGEIGRKRWDDDMALQGSRGGQNTKRGAETGDRDASRGDKEGKVFCVTQESVV